MAAEKDMSKYYTMGKKQVAKRTTHDDENNKYFEGWGVHRVEEHYEARYIKSAQGGGLRVFIITKDEYLKARRGDLSLSDLLNIYPNCR